MRHHTHTIHTLRTRFPWVPETVLREAIQAAQTDHEALAICELENLEATE